MSAGFSKKKAPDPRTWAAQENYRVVINVILEGEEAWIFTNAQRRFGYSKVYLARYLIKIGMVERGWLAKKYLEHKGQIRKRVVNKDDSVV